MPTCTCPMHRAKADGRELEYEWWITQRVMAYVAGEPMPECPHEWQQVRTIAHPWRGEPECRLCYRLQRDLL